MADFTIYELGIAPNRTDSILWVQQPSGDPSGYTDLQIDIDTLLAAEQARLTANEASITALGTRVTTLENSSTKTYDASKVTFTKTQAANSLITFFGFTTKTGTPTVKVGTSAGLDDIVSERQIDSSGFRGIDVIEFSATSRTIYITITSGTCDVVTFQRLNLNS